LLTGIESFFWAFNPQAAKRKEINNRNTRKLFLMRR